MVGMLTVFYGVIGPCILWVVEGNSYYDGKANRNREFEAEMRQSAYELKRQTVEQRLIEDIERSD